MMSPPELPEGCTEVMNTSFSVTFKKSFWPSPALREVIVTVGKCTPWAHFLASTGEALS